MIAFAPKSFGISFPRIPFPETIKLRIRGFPVRKVTSCKTCHYEANCCEALYGWKCAMHCGLIANGCSQANWDVSCVRNMTCYCILNLSMLQLSTTCWNTLTLKNLANNHVLHNCMQRVYYSLCKCHMFRVSTCQMHMSDSSWMCSLVVRLILWEGMLLCTGETNCCGTLTGCCVVYCHLCMEIIIGKLWYQMFSVFGCFSDGNVRNT